MSNTLPILPMRAGVLFPGMSLPISAARPQTLRAIEAALRDPGHKVLVLAQRDDEDEVTVENLYTLGTVATIRNLERGLGGVRLVLEGHERGIAIRIAPKDGYLASAVSEVAELQPLDAKDSTFVALSREVRVRAAELAKKRGVSADAVEQRSEEHT